MGPLVGVIRLVVCIFVLLNGAILIVITGLLPIRIRHAPLAAWIAVGMARAFCILFNIFIRSHNSDRLSNHGGFIFPNHLSYLDIITLMHIAPVRFLSAAEVLSYPVVGWIAQKIGTVFVRREDRSSRRQAREDIANALRQSSRPPIVLFPEGRLGTGDKLFPFRHGAFAIAIETQVAFLPCALHYSEPEVMFWRGIVGETLLPAVWRLATYWGPTYIDAYFLEPVQPSVDADPTELATTTAGKIEEYGLHEIDPKVLT